MRILFKKDMTTGLPFIIIFSVVLTIYVLLERFSAGEDFSEIIITLKTVYFIVIFFVPFSDDAKTKFTEYMLTWPITRRRLVDAKYIELLILWAILIFFGFVSHPDNLFFHISSSFATPIALAFTLPFIFKFGTSKSRTYMLYSLITFMVAISIMILFEDKQSLPLVVGYPVTAILLLISWQCSRRIIMGREF